MRLLTRKLIISLCSVCVAVSVGVLKVELKIFHAREEVNRLVTQLPSELKNQIQKQRQSIDKLLFLQNSAFLLIALLLGFLVFELNKSLRETTKQTAATEAAKKSEQEIAMILAGVAHDIRGYLFQIFFSLEMIESYGVSEKTVNKIYKGARNMNNLVDNVLVFSENHWHINPEQLDLFGVVEEVVKDWREQTDRVIVLQSQKSNTIWIDKIWVSRALYNLISNAIKYSAEPTPVIVAVNGNSVTVGDQGRGLDKQTQQKLFKAFVRGNNTIDTTGAGLGLVNVKNCMDLHGGTVEVYSNQKMTVGFLKVNTIFRLNFP